MRAPLVAFGVSLLLAGAHAVAQTPAQPAPTPSAPAPATQKPRPRAAAPSTAPVNATITVTDGVGTPIEGVEVTATGPLDRSGTTDSSGVLRIQGLRAGTYRLRFDREGYVPFERELVTQGAQKVMEVAVTLSEAPAPPPPPAPPPAPEPVRKPAEPGEPRTLALTDWLEKNFIGNREPQKVSSLGCSGGSESVVWQIREPWPNRRHEDADATLYVIGGEGTLRLDGRDQNIAAGSLAIVPRGLEYGFTRRGRNPLIVLAVLAGDGC